MNDYIFIFDTPVHCNDEPCGKLSKIAFDPKNWHVSDFVVEEGLLLKKSRVFPFTVIDHADENAIHIAVNKEDLKNYPEYRETVVERLPDSGVVEPAAIQGSPYGLATSAPAVPMIKEHIIEGVADHLNLVSKDTPVEATDATVGKVRGLAIAPENGLISHILIHKGTIFVEEFWLSTAVVDRISPKGAFVNMTRDELDDLIEYDEEQDEYWDHMPTDEVLEAPTPAVVSTHDPERQYNENQPTYHNLNDAAALPALIAEALMDDPRTEAAVIEVIHERGMITLQGSVNDARTKEAAVEIASSYPGVVSVTSELAVERR